MLHGRQLRRNLVNSRGHRCNDRSLDAPLVHRLAGDDGRLDCVLGAIAFAVSHCLRGPSELPLLARLVLHVYALDEFDFAAQLVKDLLDAHISFVQVMTCFHFQVGDLLAGARIRKLTE